MMKNCKYIFIGSIALLSLVACKTPIPFVSPNFSVGDIIEFGRYPTSKVTKPEVISWLNDMVGELPTPTDSKSWTPYNWYISFSNETKFAWYVDVDKDNDKQYDYRGVYFTSYRPKLTSIHSSDETSYQDNNGYFTSTVYWFRYEPIKWRVLEKSEDYFVMSDKIIDSTHFCLYNTNPDIDSSSLNKEDIYYKNSDLRKFLNNDFYNTAFSLVETNVINTTIVDNSVSTMQDLSSEFGCENTNDKVFALSYLEVTNPSYGFNETDTKDDKRKLIVSDYAACMGCYIYENSGFWWFRSPGCTGLIYGLIATSSSYEDADGGIVPALHLQYK